LLRIHVVICENGELRLVGGSTNLEGRLEVCWNETWGTVCDGFWSTSDAKVACRQLGFSTRSGSYTAYSNAHFGEGEGPILLDDLICTGSESRLIDCSHEPIGQYDFCTHNDDAGLRCEERTCATS
jgi:deleted-in-malignant-brain-tumors protein 1